MRRRAQERQESMVEEAEEAAKHEIFAYNHQDAGKARTSCLEQAGTHNHRLEIVAGEMATLCGTSQPGKLQETLQPLK